MSAIEELKWRVFENFEKDDFKKNFDIPIWRFISFPSLLEIFAKKRMSIGKVNRWEDTYENFIYKGEFYLKGKLLDIKSYSKNSYGQCWTLLEETDALWRIYSHDAHGLSIKTSVIKLFNLYLNLGPLESKMSFKIGKVKYLSKQEIVDYLYSHELLRDIPNSMNQFLLHTQFIKRKEFYHEYELRLILFLLIDVGEINIPIVPNDFIEEITFDPRIPQKIFETYKATLEQIGYTGNIKKSNLYDIARIRIIKD